MKRKITEIAVFEFFLCMFVILIHLLSEGVDTFPKWSFWSILFFSLTRLTTFAVPGFIFTSAIKMFYKYRDVKKFNYPRFLWDRFKKIYVPYLIAVAIYYLVFVFVLHTYNFDWHQLLQFIQTGDISAQFYFIILIIHYDKMHNSIYHKQYSNTTDYCHNLSTLCPFHIYPPYHRITTISPYTK